MPAATVLSIIESPTHPNFSALFKRLGLTEIKLNTMRKAIGQLKKSQPDFVIAEFSYGYSNNYAGVNVSNLDVMLASLRKYAPQAKVVVMVDKSEYQYVEKLQALFALHAVLQYPISEAQLAAALGAVQP